MNVIKNFLPENTGKKIYAVMSLDYFKQVTLDEYIKPANCSVDDYTAKILLDKVELTADKKINFTFKCAPKTNEQKAGEYTLTYTYPDIKEMDCIKFIGYSDEEPDGFMKDLEETLNSLKN